MLGCVLRVSGPYNSLVVIAGEAFVPLMEARGSALARERGEARAATFNYLVSSASDDHVHEAEEFLRANIKDLRDLISQPCVQCAVLDFGCELDSDKIGCSTRLPSSFLALCAEVSLDVELSVYLVEAPGGSM